jgi:hypothetical protein
MSKSNIHPYLSDKLYKKFKTYCKAKGITESSVVEAALQEYLDDSADVKLLYRRLDRMNRAIGRLERDLNVSSEFNAVFMQLWLAHTPELPNEHKEGANRKAMARYHAVVNHVVKALGGGKKCYDDFVQERLADDDELNSILEEKHKDDE